jgi:phage shock protein A
MEEKIEQRERQIRASSEIDEEFSGDKLAKDFKQLERGATAGTADMQLLALKQKMGMLPAPAPQQNRQLNAGQGARPSSEMSTAELLAVDHDDVVEEK